MTLAEAVRALAPPLDEDDTMRRTALQVAYEELHRLAPLVVRDSALCQEIASQAFMNLMSAGGRGALDGVGPSEGAARGYLRAALRNAFIDHVRRGRPEVPLADDNPAAEPLDSGLDPEAQLEFDELRSALGRAVRHLREVVVPMLGGRMKQPHGRGFAATVEQLLEIAGADATTNDIVRRLHGEVTTKTRNAVDQQHKRGRDRIARWFTDDMPAEGLDDGLVDGLRMLLERLRRR
jgi:DNA-directed RNA polymerase specialized sigma24 family protein